MRFNNNLRTTFLVATGLACCLPGAEAFQYNDRDLLLVFQKAGRPDMEVNLGPVSELIALSPGASMTFDTYNSSQLLSAMGNLNGMSWAVLGAVRVGNGDGEAPNNTLWLTAPRLSLDEPAAAWVRKSNSTQGSARSVILGVANGAVAWSAGTPADVVGNTDSVAIIPTTEGVSYTAGAGSSGSLNGSFGQGSVQATTPMDFNEPQRSDFYQLNPATGNPSGTLLGSFDLDATGSLTYTAVPEPSAVALLSLAGLGLAGVQYYRRKQ